MLTEKDYEYLIKATGDKSIREKIESSEEMSLEPTKVHHFAEQDYDILVKNLKESGNSKDSYEEGKKVGLERTIKDVRKALNLEFEGVKIDNLIDSLKNTIETSKEGDIQKLSNDYEKRLAALQKTVEDEKAQREALINKSKSEKINYKIDNYFNALQIEVPEYIKDENQAKEFVKMEREKNKLMFKTKYSFDLDENDNIIPVKDGEVLRDEIQNPLGLDKLVNDYVSNSFIPIKKEIKGRGEEDRLPGRIAKFKTMDDLNKYAEEKGIRRNTNEFDALVLEFNKNK
jgi:hypothetical protein